MLNNITISGRLTKDPELRTTHSGTTVATFSIACDRDTKDKQTNERAVDFFDVIAWRGTGEFAAKYLSKGRMAIISGRLQNNEWTDKDGAKRKRTEILANNIYFADRKTVDLMPPKDTADSFDALSGDDDELPF